MRMLDRTIALSMGFSLASVLAPSAATAQTAPQYPAPQPSPQPSTPGYPQPQAYPQPGYPQAYPQPGYPQAYPQPGYPQAYPQPGYPQAYPQPGYPPQAVPPPGYYAPPAYTAPLPYEPPQSNDLPPTRPAYRRGVVFMPYFGLNSVVGSGSDGYSAGYHLGGVLGGHIGPVFSLNGEMALDIMSPKSGGPDADGSQVYFDFDLTPLVHFGIPYLEFVMGGKLGVFAYAGSSRASGQYQSKTDYTGSGLAYGFTAGVFIPVGRVALGTLFNFTGHSFSDSSCTSGSSGTCGSSSSDFKFITFSVALLI